MTRSLVRLLMGLMLVVTIGCTDGSAPAGQDASRFGVGAPPAPTATSVPPTALALATPTPLPTILPTPTLTTEPTASAPPTATELPTATESATPTEPPATVAATATLPQRVALTPSPPTTEGCPYIGNRNTGVFHHAGCSSVAQMAERNKVCLASREEALQRGFRPCQRCHP